MRKHVLVGSLLLAFGVAASAQEVVTPKIETGLNYSFTHDNPGGFVPSYNANGGFGYVQYNFSKSFGLVADLGANYVGAANGVSIGNTTFEYLFGPRFTWRHSRISPYVQTLVGGERYSNGFNPAVPFSLLQTSQNNFAMAIGGGVDVTVTNRIAVQPVQVDYLMTEFSPGSGFPSNAANGLRYSAGVVFRFGSK